MILVLILRGENDIVRSSPPENVYVEERMILRMILILILRGENDIVRSSPPENVHVEERMILRRILRGENDIVHLRMSM